MALLLHWGELSIRPERVRIDPTDDVGNKLRTFSWSFCAGDHFSAVYGPAEATLNLRRPMTLLSLGLNVMNRVLVVGSATIDKIERSGTSAVKMGGVVTYAGITFQKHGLQTAVLSNVAPQDTGLFQILRRQDITLFNGVTEATTVFVNHIDGDTRWQEMPVHAKPIMADQLRRSIQDFDHLHLGPLHPLDMEPELLGVAARRGICITVDVQGYTRRVEKGRVHPAISENLHDVLLASTIIKADRIELQAILDAYQMGVDDLINAYTLSEVVVTAGREGGYVALASSDMIRYESPRVSHVVDPTGAGDVFFAAYLVSRLREHRSVRAACKQAAFIAARQVQGRYIPEDCLKLEI